MFKNSTIGSNDYIEVLFEASDDIVMVLDQEHVIIKGNSAFHKTFFSSSSSSEKRFPFELLIGSESYRRIFKPTIKACIEKNKKAVISKWSEHNGQKKFLQWTFHPLPDGMIGQAYILAIGKDQTELQNLKEEISQKDMELKSLIRSEKEYVYFLNASLQVFDCNNLGLYFAKENAPNGFYLGDHAFDFLPEKYHLPLAEIIKEVIQEKRVIKRQKFHQKTERHYELTFKPILSLSGRTMGAIVIATDVTAEKVAEKELHLSRNKLKSIFDSSIQSIFLLGKNFEVLEFNKRAFDDIKKIWNKELAIGDCILNYFQSTMSGRFWECFNNAIAGDKSVIEVKIDYPNGLKVWSEVTFFPVYNMEGEIFGVSFSTLDITERKTVEAKLCENEANLSSLIENNNTLVWSVDRSYKLILLNSQFQTFFKNILNIELLPGMNILDCLDTATARYLKKLLDRVYQGLSVREDYKIPLATGEVIIELIMNPIVSEDRIIGASVFSMDITDRKYREIELEQLNNSYRQEIEIRKKIEEDLKFKNNELDTFIYKASHDLRGPIASLMGLYNAATIEIKDKKSLEYLEYINKTAQRMDQVLKALISLSEIKDKAVNLENTHLQQIIKDTMDVLEIKNNLLDIDFNMEIPDLSFYTDAGLFMVIVKNLLENAMRYSRLTIKAEIHVKIEVLPNKGIQLLVTDNGLGMEPQIQDKVFNMFFKGNNLSPGSGLGLYMVKSAAYKLGGKVALKSTINKGTTFMVYLPEIKYAQ